MNQATTLDDGALGHAVDAWLVGLRRQGLSNRRIRNLAGLLGQAMSDQGPQTPEQERVVRRFEAWWHNHDPRSASRQRKKRVFFL